MICEISLQRNLLSKFQYKLKIKKKKFPLQNLQRCSHLTDASHEMKFGAFLASPAHTVHTSRDKERMRQTKNREGRKEGWKEGNERQRPKKKRTGKEWGKKGKGNLFKSAFDAASSLWSCPWSGMMYVGDTEHPGPAEGGGMHMWHARTCVFITTCADGYKGREAQNLQRISFIVN